MWREKTFQAIALTVLVLLMFVGLGEIVAELLSSITRGGAPCAEPAAGFVRGRFADGQSVERDGNGRGIVRGLALWCCRPSCWRSVWPRFAFGIRHARFD